MQPTRENQIRGMERIYQTAQRRRVPQLPTHAISAYGEPPFQYRDAWLVQLPFLAEPQLIDALVPSPLKTNGDGGVLLSINRLEAVGLGFYHEVALSVPCHFDLGTPDPFGVPPKPRSSIAGEYATYHPALGCISTHELSGHVLSGQYLLVLYVNTDIPIAVGRELWGFPKKGAQIYFEEKAGVITTSVEREGITLIRATLTLDGERCPAELQDVNWQFHTWFNLKLIPSVQSGMQHPDVAQLTSTTLQNLSINHIYRGQSAITFGSSSADPLDMMTVRQLEPGYYIQADGDLTYGSVLHDYLAR